MGKRFFAEFFGLWRVSYFVVLDKDLLCRVFAKIQSAKKTQTVNFENKLRQRKNTRGKDFCRVFSGLRHVFLIHSKDLFSCSEFFPSYIGKQRGITTMLQISWNTRYISNDEGISCCNNTPVRSIQLQKVHDGSHNNNNTLIRKANKSHQILIIRQAIKLQTKSAWIHDTDDSEKPKCMVL
jgi:hypothetical protein